MASSQAQCDCGATRFYVSGPALLRAYCHCTICQAYNQGPFADVCLFRAQDVEVPPAEQVSFKSWQPPGLVLRGQCTACSKPALEKLRMPGLPKLVLVPSANLADSVDVPQPKLHMFYNSRVADMDDKLPKYNGYLASQMGYMRHMLPILFKR